MAEEGRYYESRFVCGKSLVGRMSSHGMAYSAESDDFEHQSNSKDSKVAESGNGQQSSYVLRENPKKTWRAADTLRIPSPQYRICKQCGKAFQSMKALCGHMACHSEKDKNSKDEGSWTSENLKAHLYSSSDTEEGEEKRNRTRSSSKSKRYKKFVEKSHLFALAHNNVNSYNNWVNGSSSISEIDGQDHEEVAMCLMLLSRDLGNNYSVVESSDNNSVVLETKSSSTEMRLEKMESMSYIHNNHGEKEKIGNTENYKSKAKILDEEEAAQMEDFDSDSGYFLDECSKNEDYIVEFRNSSTRNECQKSSKGDGCDNRDIKAKRKDRDDNSRNKSKYECHNCKKTFKSYQALGGHRPCHKWMNSFHETKYGSGENSPDESPDHRKKKSSAEKSKANKGKNHVCPFCDRIFKNGQALGGHKRSHFLTGRVEKNANRAKAEVRDLLDLNLPAPEEEEEDN